MSDLTSPVYHRHFNSRNDANGQSQRPRQLRSHLYTNLSIINGAKEHLIDTAGEEEGAILLEYPYPQMLSTRRANLLHRWERRHCIQAEQQKGLNHACDQFRFLRLLYFRHDRLYTVQHTK